MERHRRQVSAYTDPGTHYLARTRVHGETAAAGAWDMADPAAVHMVPWCKVVNPGASSARPHHIDCRSVVAVDEVEEGHQEVHREAHLDLDDGRRPVVQRYSQRPRYAMVAAGAEQDALRGAAAAVDAIPMAPC